ncbi:uncharacterized protein B0H18DRAFT_957787 [Fomitopsis serialis]|uniref:uncharacterized protein n=1 Tax=Fomitopsis serialis TaxID=139415 RepID=UPI0020082EF0|nr:uncharacterized protein B0H18DRAFT_957787 [Neoantrodia serialis]KAH9918787.1 hypothetical protein B0H18DRAFT_957787 [Neoantrodia serialis]
MRFSSLLSPPPHVVVFLCPCCARVPHVVALSPGLRTPPHPTPSWPNRLGTLQSAPRRPLGSTSGRWVIRRLVQCPVHSFTPPGTNDKEEVYADGRVGWFKPGYHAQYWSSAFEHRAFIYEAPENKEGVDAAFVLLDFKRGRCPASFYVSCVQNGTGIPTRNFSLALRTLYDAELRRAEELYNLDRCPPSGFLQADLESAEEDSDLDMGDSRRRDRGPPRLPSLVPSAPALPVRREDTPAAPSLVNMEEGWVNHPAHESLANSTPQARTPHRESEPPLLHEDSIKAVVSPNPRRESELPLLCEDSPMAVSLPPSPVESLAPLPMAPSPRSPSPRPPINKGKQRARSPSPLPYRRHAPGRPLAERIQPGPSPIPTRSLEERLRVEKKDGPDPGFVEDIGEPGPSLLSHLSDSHSLFTRLGTTLEERISDAPSPEATTAPPMSRTRSRTRRYGALLMWLKSRDTQVEALNRPPGEWEPLKFKVWKGRLRPDAALSRTLKTCPLRPLPDSKLPYHRNPQPDEEDKEVWELRTFHFRSNVERVVAAKHPAMKATMSATARGALWAGIRDRIRRVWGAGLSVYPSYYEPRYLDSEDDVVRLAHWCALGRILLELDVRDNIAKDLRLVVGALLRTRWTE